MNGSASNLPDGAGRSFATSFSGQSGAASPIFHHAGEDHLLDLLHFFLPFSCIIARLLLQELFKGCTVFTGAITFPTYLLL